MPVEPPVAEAPADDLTWLRRREDPRVLRFLEKENERTRDRMSPFAALEAELYAEFRGRIEETDRSVPAPRGGYLYYHRTEAGKPYRIHARVEAPDGPEEILLDENALAAGFEYCRIGMHAVSPDQRRLAYTCDTTGAEDYSLIVRDLETGEDVPAGVERASEEIAWASDGASLFYVTRDARKRPHRVYRHRVGFDAADDDLVFQEDEEAYHVSIRRSRSGRFIFIETTSAITTATWIVDAARPGSAPHPLTERRRGVEHEAVDGGDALFVRTNESAVNFRLMRVPLDEDVAPAPREEWREEIAHRPSVMLEDVDAFGRALVLTEREGGMRHLTIRLRDGGAFRVPIEGAVRTVQRADNLEFEAEEFRYVVESPVRPPTTMSVDFATRRTRVLKVEPVPGFEPSRYETHRLYATAPDGAKVPISILAPAGVELDGANPCLLNGYGSYGVCYEPVFSREALGLVDRGFVYAIAHVRGGGELGETWHDEGKMLRKRNTFTDFISCAERLVEEGFTAPDRLGIQGRSAGGLLMGAAANLRPDLFRTVVAGVPFVDVLATMLDPSIPLTVIEYDEWGDPRDPQYYDYIRSYSPFDNVRETDYPHMLVTAGLHDPRVQYWEPARWVARLRERRSDDRLLLLKTDTGAGHMGPSDRFEKLRDRAFEFAFVIATLAPDRAGEAIGA